MFMIDYKQLSSQIIGCKKINGSGLMWFVLMLQSNTWYQNLKRWWILNKCVKFYSFHTFTCLGSPHSLYKKLQRLRSNLPIFDQLCSYFIYLFSQKFIEIYVCVTFAESCSLLSVFSLPFLFVWLLTDSLIVIVTSFILIDLAEQCTLLHCTAKPDMLLKSNFDFHFIIYLSVQILYSNCALLSPHILIFTFCHIYLRRSAIV